MDTPQEAWSLPFLIPISALFHRDISDYFWVVYVHGNSFWNTGLGF